MVSDKPTRRSKSASEPVTIDLDAKDIVVTPRESVEPVTEAAAKSESGVPATDATGLDTPEIATDGHSQTADHKVKVTSEYGTEEVVNPAAGEFPPETTAQQASETENETAGNPFAEELPHRQGAAKSAPGTPALIAAGILGGLIALAAAGSMQYAGYLPTSGPTQSGGAVSGEIEALKQQLASLQSSAAAGTSPELEKRIAALEAGSAQTGAATADAATTEKLAALESEIGGLKANLSQASQSQAASSGTLTQRLDAAEKKLNEPRDDIEVARAIAAAGLKAAIDRGGPFLTEIETFAGVAPDDPSVAALRGFAPTGVPSRAELMREFPTVANAMLEAIHQPDPSQGIAERLMSSAMSIIKVRPVGNIVGEAPEAVTARMEDKLRNGDLTGSALEWNALPDAAKTVSTAFKQSLDARIQVENLVATTLNRAVAGTAKQN
jgi:hypothetical protein